MKRAIIPALSLVFLAGLSGQAQASDQPSFQIAARNTHGSGHAGPAADTTTPADTGDRGHRGRGHTGTPAGTATTGGGGGSGGGGGGGTGAGTGSPFGAGGTATHGDHTGGGTATGGGGGTGAGGGSPFGVGGTAARGDHRGDRTITGGRLGGSIFGTRPQNWNRFPREFDRNTYRRNYSAPNRFHWQSYNRPHGWYYQRWTFGQVLPSIFWAQNYWLTDYWMFGLPVPPYGYVWVRYGDDALLINRRSGEVLQVVYGLFD